MSSYANTDNFTRIDTLDIEVSDLSSVYELALVYESGYREPGDQMQVEVVRNQPVMPFKTALAIVRRIQAVGISVAVTTDTDIEFSGDTSINVPSDIEWKGFYDDYSSVYHARPGFSIASNTLANRATGDGLISDVGLSIKLPSQKTWDDVSESDDWQDFPVGTAESIKAAYPELNPETRGELTLETSVVLLIEAEVYSTTWGNRFEVATKDFGSANSPDYEKFTMNVSLQGVDDFTIDCLDYMVSGSEIKSLTLSDHYHANLKDSSGNRVWNKGTGTLDGSLTD